MEEILIPASIKFCLLWAGSLSPLEAFTVSYCV